MRRRAWTVVVIVSLVAAAVGVWLATRPPTMFVLGVYALDAERALIATRRNEDDDTRFWIAKVQVGVGTVWSTELPAQVDVALGVVRAARHGETLTVALDPAYVDGAPVPPALATIDLGTGALRGVAPLPETWGHDLRAPLAVGRFALFEGWVQLDPACREVTCDHEARVMVVDTADATRFAICPPTSPAACDLRLPLAASGRLERLGERLVASSPAGLQIVDLAARTVGAVLADARASCRDGDDLLVVDADGPARLRPSGELERLASDGSRLRECAPIGDALVWSATRGMDYFYVATDRRGAPRWSAAPAGPTDGYFLGSIGRPPSDAARARYVPVYDQGSVTQKGGTRWLDVVAGRLGAAAWPDMFRIEAPLWASATRVIHRDAGAVAIHDAEHGTLLDVLAAEASATNLAGGRLWLAAPIDAWRTIDDLPWVALDPETLAVVGAGSEWRPRSVKAELEARLGPFPAATP